MFLNIVKNISFRVYESNLKVRTVNVEEKKKRIYINIKMRIIIIFNGYR